MYLHVQNIDEKYISTQLTCQFRRSIITLYLDLNALLVLSLFIFSARPARPTVANNQTETETEQQNSHSVYHYALISKPAIACESIEGNQKTVLFQS